MLTSPRLMEYVTAEPFRPFRINMASGQSFEIRHPEMILVGKSLVRVYQAAGEVPGQPPLWHDGPGASQKRSLECQSKEVML